ncbi:16S rRNA (guanine(527)-N(7))-methyltransferase RsmG [Pseudanabaena sp. FACHB-1998]|uniref:16S rRNA (guanine(527)-N(7))-methyltransferase RsmG n=1 Tax=Pseudanabaena sp. FACHB-1998 TaxID=2692858 RepID=UPI001681AF28|nr:16S rRNA (guanine(527)-N(7))-methyltransferase RsmG [Pseudanabaena sp. FACHB-1998]MBD2177664.1 16S rRNA (guanine(527)-N(7))-methyltransferase RsmG [Pseudanabaena sp. FACHB-1998]
MSHFSHLFEHWQSTLNWSPSPDQLEQFEKLYELVLEGNSQQNLTRITAPDDFWEKHLWDSLRGVLNYWERENLQVIDIGTGAGFPGLPIAIAKPSWQVTLVDSKQKKVAFVEQTIKDLQLTNAIAEAGRAEDINKISPYKKKYDLAVVRAVGSPDLCASYCLPFLKKNGTAILYRGQWLPEESEQLDIFCEEQGLQVVQQDRFQTPLTMSIRHSVYLSPRSTSISNS